MARKKNPVLDEPQEDKPESDPLKLCRDRFKEAQEYWSEEYEDALEDIEFRAGKQWPEHYKNLRENPNNPRPCLVVDKLNQYVRQIVNDGRQNRPSIKVRPVDSGSDIQTAESVAKRVASLKARWAIKQKTNARIPADVVLEIFNSVGKTYKSMAKEFGVSIGMAWRIKNGLSRKVVTNGQA